MTKSRDRLSQTQSKKKKRKKGINNATGKYFKAALDVGHVGHELTRSSGAEHKPGENKKDLLQWIEDVMYCTCIVPYNAEFT